MSIESVMPSNHLVLWHPLLLPPSIFPSIRVFSNESALHIRWPKYWSFSFSISPSNEYSGLISFRMNWLDLLQSKGLSRVFSNTETIYLRLGLEAMFWDSNSAKTRSTWFQDLMKPRLLISHHRKNSVRDKVIVKKWI